MCEEVPAPDSTAVRVALWRALHVQIDPPPHVLEDEVGLRLVAPEEDWRRRPDMDPVFTQPFRASIVGCALYVMRVSIAEIAAARPSSDLIRAPSSAARARAFGLSVNASAAASRDARRL